MSTTKYSSTQAYSMLEHELMPEECRNKFCNLPKEMGWINLYFYQYKAFWLADYQFEYISAGEELFAAQDIDIIIASSMKCGTTWLKSLAFVIHNRMHYFPTDTKHPLLTKNPHELVLNLEFNDYPSSSLYATHLPYVLLPNSVKRSECKLIYISRNPKDAFVSYWHFFNKLPQYGSLSIEEAFEKFCRGVSWFGPFWDHVLQYWKKSLECPNKVLFLRYEELREEPNLHIRRIADFMGCPFSEEEEASGIVNDILNLCSFKNLSNLEVNKSGKSYISGIENNIYFRHATTEDWKHYLTPEMANQIDLITAEKFQEFGLVL